MSLDLTGFQVNVNSLLLQNVSLTLDAMDLMMRIDAPEEDDDDDGGSGSVKYILTDLSTKN